MVAHSMTTPVVRRVLLGKTPLPTATACTQCNSNPGHTSTDTPTPARQHVPLKWRPMGLSGREEVQALGVDGCSNSPSSPCMGTMEGLRGDGMNGPTNSVPDGVAYDRSSASSASSSPPLTLPTLSERSHSAPPRFMLLTLTRNQSPAGAETESTQPIPFHQTQGLAAEFSGTGCVLYYHTVLYRAIRAC